MSGFRDDTRPWSFFVPITLAVVVGVLAADAIRYAVVTVFAGHDAPLAETAPADTAEPDASRPAANGGASPDTGGDAADQGAAGGPGAVPVNAASLPAGAADARQGKADADPVPVASTLQELPGPLNARRDGNNAACINGTVTYRSGNGWEQSLENDAPIRCTATSP